MPVAEILGTSTPDTMNAEDTTGSLDTFIRQAVGKEPFFSFSRTGDNPLQWIQFLHNMDQPECDDAHLPGWPLLTPVKVQMHKCDKCAREFCSAINYRRHIRVHRRSMNFLKEPQKFRDILGTFWDKLSYDKAKEIMSLKDANLEEVPGSSIVRNIVSNIRNPIFFSLPQAYVKAGSALVDIIQGNASLPTSSQELFSVLDDASERTFLCAGTAETLHKYVFDGEVRKTGLELRNLVACTTFLVEQELVKAWLADKDAEALRCQKLLVEEEEASQRRQAELLERKRRRKLRQKEQRARDGLKADLYPASDIFESIPSAESSSPRMSPEADPLIPDEYAVTTLDRTQLSSNEEVVFIDHSDFFATEQEKTQGNGSHDFIARWQVPKKSQRASRNGFRSNQNGNMIKWEHAHKHREQKINGSKVWTRKSSSENDGELIQSRIHNVAINQTTQSNCQLMIGSISVTVRNSTGQHQVNSQLEFKENGNTEVKTKGAQNSTDCSNVKFWRPRHDVGGQLADRSNSQILEEHETTERGTDQTLSDESHQKSCNLNGLDSKGTNDSNVQAEDRAKVKRIPFSIDGQQNGAHRSSVKFWRPRHDTGGQLGDRSNSQIFEEDAASESDTDQTLSNESHQKSCDLIGLDSEGTHDSNVQAEDGAKAERIPFSIDAAKAFLSQRWKEAISGDHVELFLTSAPEPPGQLDVQDDHQASEAQEYILPKGQVGKTAGMNSSTHATVEPKLRKKTDKSIKTKYIPKQRAFTSG